MRRFTALAVVVALAWLAAAAWSGPFSGRLSEVIKNDSAAFLPADAEATKAQDLASRFNDGQLVPSVVVYERLGGLSAADAAVVATDRDTFSTIEGVVGPLPPPQPSEDGQALELIVPIDGTAAGGDIDTVVEELRATASKPAGLNVHVTGPAGLLADQISIFKSIDGTLLLVTAIVVVLILLVVYRSPVLWLFPIISAAVAFAGSAAVVYLLADRGIIALNGQAQGILTVLVFGAGTDYALLLIARYREELHHHENRVTAMLAALRGAAPAIVASAATVIASLLCLLLSGLNSNRALGPVSAAGIAVTLVVMLTLLPALLVLAGRWVFWPRVPRAGAPTDTGRVWARVAGLIGRRARRTWALTSLGLVALVFGLSSLDTSGLSQTEVFTGRPDSVLGQEALARHYPAGTGSPALVFARTESAEAVAAAVSRVNGVTDARLVTADPATPPAVPGAPAAPKVVDGAAPKVVDGWVQLQATLADPADSPAAEATVTRLRDAVGAVPAAEAVVGGVAAISLDTRTASERDRNVIIPVVLLVVGVILALLLRAIVAPLLLVATVVLSFAATLGLCGLLFTHVFGFAGADPSLPLFAFVFLVALGVDYNIFLMSRVREEAAQHGTRKGVLRGLVLTGGVITSAGVVLAATFSALAVLPLVVLVELGVVVAIGVLIDTIVVRSLLVPALAYDLGRRVWWPSRLGAGTEGKADRDAPARLAGRVK